MTSRAVLFLTHKITSSIMRAYQRLRDELGSGYRVYLVLNGKAIDQLVLDRYQVKYHFTFETGDLIGLPYSRKIDRDNFHLIPGHLDLITQIFSQKVSSDFYWYVEYDVDFSGNWRDLLSYFDENSQADLLGSTMFPRADFENWPHWATLQTGDHILSSSHLVRSFIPIHRVSRRGLSIADGLYQRGWAGHSEVTLTTMFLHSGLIIEDFGGDGPYVKPANINRFYWNSIRKKGLSPGTLTFRPVIATKPVLAPRPFWKIWGKRFEPNKIWHPIKI